MIDLQIKLKSTVETKLNTPQGSNLNFFLKCKLSLNPQAAIKTKNSATSLNG